MNQVTPTSLCKTMDKVYESLRKLTVSEIQECINRAPVDFAQWYAESERDYKDIYAAECLFVHQCLETISRKHRGVW